MKRHVQPGSASNTSWLLLFAGLLLACPATASDASPAVITLPKVSQPPRIEDYVNEASRPEAVQISDFRQRQPKDGAPVSQSTAAYLSYDDDNLYAMFVCKDEPGKVRAHMSRRESISSDDVVGLLVDTFHDGRRAYMFYANPLGIQLDGITTEGQPDDYTFDAVWHSEGRVVPDGFIVRFVIPFKSIRLPKMAGRTWGLALLRTIRRNQEYAMWPRVSDRIEAFVPQFGTADGLDPVKPGRNIQIMPYGFFEAERFLEGGRMRRENEIRGGVDTKMVLHDSLTLDVTANPDFSQVESDEPQVTINQRFEVYFPEKRPFFLDNAGFFQTPETLFFSRRIVNPQFGARLTGKLGDWGLGLLAADDRAPGVRLGTENGEDGTPRARMGVLRVQREFGSESNAGFFVSSYRLGSLSNQVYSADARFKINPNWIATGQAMRSASTSGAGGSPQAGSAYFGEIRHSGRHFNYYTNYRDRDPEFHTELGYVPRVDLRQVRNSASYRWRPETGSLVSFGPSVYTLVDWDHSGKLQDWLVESAFTLNFRGPSSIEISREEAYEYYQARGFRKRGTAISAATERWKWFGAAGSFRKGMDVNYYPAAGLAPFGAASQDATASLFFRPGPRVRFDESYVYSRLAGPATVFDNHIIRSKLNYQFTRALSVRAILDYSAVLPNVRLVDLERAKRINIDILATYMLNPGTALYVGYGNRFENLMPPAFQRVSVPGYSTGRQVFVKLSYLFRL